MANNGLGNLTLRAIEIFVAVIEEGSFSTGARRLGASTSSVSQQVTNLEAALRARLIDRAVQGVTLDALVLGEPLPATVVTPCRYDPSNERVRG